MKKELSERSVKFFRQLGEEMGLDLAAVTDEEIVEKTSTALYALASKAGTGDTITGVSILQRIYGRDWHSRRHLL